MFTKQLVTNCCFDAGYFDEKAMPSAGLMSFAQTFVCTFNNTCHMEAPTEFSKRKAYNDTL